MQWIFDGWPSVARALVKAAAMYLVVVIGLRLAHRRTLAQWSAIDFAAAVALGAIVGRTAIAADQSLAVGVAALVAILVGHYLLTVSRRIPRFAYLIDHSARVLVDHGRLRGHQLRRCGLTESELLAQLRRQGVTELGDLRYVIYESKGDVTVVREPGPSVPDQPLIRAGLAAAVDYPSPADRASDGQLDDDHREHGTGPDT